MSSFQERVVQWANDRNLIEGSDPKSQMCKLVEEIGELAAAIARGDKTKAEDGIGDAAVVLVILSEQLDLSYEGCQELAWSEIKDRKGRMVDGVFIKENE